MRYLISTTAKNGAAECEANLRKLGAIGPGDRVQYLITAIIVSLLVGGLFRWLG
jgi:hypothetical protein